MGAVAEVSGIAQWFNDVGQYIAIGLQMLYWIVVASAAVFAAVQAKRYVDFLVGASAPAAAGDEDEDEPVSVEEFVD